MHEMKIDTYATTVLLSLVAPLLLIVQCGTMTLADLATMDESAIDNFPLVGVISENSAEPLENSGGCMGIRSEVLGQVPKDEKGAKVVSKVCGHINRAPCESEEACVERCKEACKQDALAKVL